MSDGILGSEAEVDFFSLSWKMLLYFQTNQALLPWT